jgi:hypothetical protein
MAPLACGVLAVATESLVFRDSITVIRPLAPSCALKRSLGLGWVRRHKTEPLLPSTIVDAPSYTLGSEGPPSSEPPPPALPPMPERTLPLPAQAAPAPPSSRRVARRARPNERLAMLLVVLSLVEAVALATLLLFRS